MCHSSHRRFPAVLIVALLLGLFLALPAPAVRAGLVRWVVPITDGPVVQTGCTSILNFCSLREALAAAADGDTIQFHPQTTGTILLDPNQGALPVAHAVTIAGPGAGTLAVDGGKAVTVFTVASGVTATISGITIQHGSGTNGPGTEGGGIDNSGTLTVMQSIITDNVGMFGGAILNNGMLTVTNSTIANNSGGGIRNGGAGMGGASPATLTVVNSTIANNSSGGGGGIWNDFRTTLTVTNSTIANNSSSGGGGGIANAGTLTVTNSTFTGNSDNETFFGGGGILNIGTSFSIGTLTVTNSTITGNSAEGGFGGGIYNNNGMLTVTNSTITGNSAGAGGGIRNGGANGGAPPATLTNTLVADNPTGGDLTPLRADSYTGSHNLIDAAATAGGFTDGVNGNLVGHAALLGSLGSFGGATQTLPLLPGSPAIDRGSCPSGYHDQRGIATVGTACDIGAVESQGFLLTAAAGTNQSTAVASAFAQPLVVMVTSAHGEPVSGGQITFTAPTSGPGAAVSSSSRTIGAGATASVTATANGTAGAYSVIASAPGASSASFALANTPVLSGISPASGAIVGGNHVTLTGRGFGTSTTNVAVSIGGVAAPVASIGDTTLVVTAPAHAAGVVDVVVTVNGERVTAAGGYTYGVVSPLPNPQPSGGTGDNPAPEPGARARAVPAGNANPLPPPRP